MAAHSLLAPSSYGRLAHCRAAPTMEFAYPSEDSPSSVEGRAAHLVAQLMIESDTVLPIGTVLDGNVEVTAEMIEAARMYADDIAVTLGANWQQKVRLEVPVTLKGLHEEAYGTPDAVAQFPKFLYVWDFKYGHRYVDAFENWQLIGYSFPFVENLTTEEELNTEVILTIVQPRNFHPDGPIRRWRIKAWELRAYYNTLRGWLNEAMLEPPTASPYPTACQDCSARHVCVALRNAAYTSMDCARQAQAHGLTPDQLGHELLRVQDAAALLDAYRTGLEEEAEGAIRRGFPVPNFTMAPGRTSLEWALSEEMITDLAAGTGVSLHAPAKLITPTQARDRKLISAEALEAYTRRPPGKLKLSRIDHQLAKKVFK